MILLHSNPIQPAGRGDASRAENAPDPRAGEPDASGATAFGLGETAGPAPREPHGKGGTSDAPHANRAGGGVDMPAARVTVGQGVVAAADAVRDAPGRIASPPDGVAAKAAASPVPRGQQAGVAPQDPQGGLAKDTGPIGLTKAPRSAAHSAAPASADAAPAPSVRAADPAAVAPTAAVVGGGLQASERTPGKPVRVDREGRGTSGSMPADGARDMYVTQQTLSRTRTRATGGAPQDPPPSPSTAPTGPAIRRGSSPAPTDDGFVHAAGPAGVTDTVPQPSPPTGKPVEPATVQPAPGGDTMPVLRDGDPVRPETARPEPLRADPGRSDPARMVSTQLGDAVRHSGNGSTDVALNPEELGRVRLSLSTQDGTLHVAITAERPETQDLIRRNIAMLQSDFRAIGYTDVAFDFGPGGRETHGSAPHGQDAVPEPGDADLTGTAPQAATDPPGRAAVSTRLDLRL